ncbi:helix-turn-helix domain-containing protein [Pedobacter xixiisoli]|uniref:Helix-turn-helix n=1 Tax=Pedobacter xixiisoli TaxID=1476464 RepID=A0A286A7D0_9SPHI|nr:helix-turn-helix transcriptional regulator [Pedobacter xixiisoli]SOD17785.1 Helix-turn-helix [Pedobacter xixiisoli]
MKFLADNLRYLRKAKSLSQKEFGEKFNLNRPRYAKYEEGGAEPPLEILMQIAAYYHISVDLLISADLRDVSQEEIQQLENIMCKFR